MLTSCNVMWGCEKVSKMWVSSPCPLKLFDFQPPKTFFCCLRTVYLSQNVATYLQRDQVGDMEAVELRAIHYTVSVVNTVTPSEKRIQARPQASSLNIHDSQKMRDIWLLGEIGKLSWVHATVVPNHENWVLNWNHATVVSSSQTMDWNKS